MRLSFDLDGVICDGDSTILGLLHDKLRMRYGTPNIGKRVRHYYLSRKMILDPWNFTMPGDKVYVITGRCRLAHKWTRMWLKEWLPRAKVEFVTTPEIEALLLDGDYDTASRLIAKRKFEAIHNINIDIHFDNNPYIVEGIRKSRRKAILVGRCLK